MGAQSLSLLLRYEARLTLAACAADLVTLEPSFSKKIKSDCKCDITIK